MKTLRLTTAQALVRFLVNQHSRRDGVTQTLHPESAGHLRPRQRGRPRGGASSRGQRSALHSRPQRAGPGPHRRRLREDDQPSADPRLHEFDRAGRHQHGHGRRRSHHQPRARAAPARRHLRDPPGGAGAPATRVAVVAGRLRERRLPAGLALLGSHQPPRPARDLGARSHARAHKRRRHGRRHLVPSRGCAERGVGFPRGILREPGLGHPQASPRCGGDSPARSS